MGSTLPLTAVALGAAGFSSGSVRGDVVLLRRQERIVHPHCARRQQQYEPGDYIKVEFPDETTGIEEWMWVIVQSRDDQEAAGLRHARQRASE